MDKPAVRILLADDHAVLRAGLRMLLDAKPDMEIVGEADEGLQAIELARSLSPDVILLDLTMPGMDGLTALPRLKQTIPETHILILTMHEDEAYLRQALRSGASGYVLKRAVDTELVAAIRAVVRGEIYVHPAMTKLLLSDILNEGQEVDGNDAQLWAELSEREQQVMQGIVLGYTSGEIAEQNHLSVKTVYTYRTRAMTKLGIETRAQLVDMAIRLGLLRTDL